MTDEQRQEKNKRESKPYKMLVDSLVHEGVTAHGRGSKVMLHDPDRIETLKNLNAIVDWEDEPDEPEYDVVNATRDGNPALDADNAEEFNSKMAKGPQYESDLDVGGTVRHNPHYKMPRGERRASGKQEQAPVDTVSANDGPRVTRNG